MHIPDGKHNSTSKPTLLESIDRLDPIGFVLFGPACIMLLLALQWGGTTYAWSSSKIIGLFVGSAVTLIVCVFWELRRGDTGLVPLSILRQRVVYSSALTTLTQFGSLQASSYYLPIWFQTIKGVNPTLSGVYYLGTVVPLVILTMMTGPLIGRIGYIAPFAIVGNALAAVGGGLIATWTPTTTTGTWIGYQIIAGVGRGMSMQLPMTAVQQGVHPSKIATSTALIVFFQFFGGSLIIALAQTDFINSLGPALAHFAPNVSAETIIDAGARSVRDVVSTEELPGVLRAYNQAIQHVFYLAAAASVAAFASSWGMGLKNIKANKKDVSVAAKEKNGSTEMTA